MENNDSDAFKQAINKKLEDAKLHSDRDKALWENVMAEINNGKTATVFRPNYYLYAAAASILLFLALGISVFFFNNKENSVATVPTIKKKTTIQLHSADNIVQNSPETKDSSGIAIINSPKTEPGNLQTKSKIKVIDEITVEASDEILNTRLSDNSIITLNKNSSIKSLKTFSKKREIWLEGGAFFDISANKNNPFVVYFDDYKLVVVGTKFNIKSRDKNSKTILVTEGTVKVYNKLNKREFVLKAEDGLNISNGSMGPMKQGINGTAFAWKNNALNFKDISLNSVVKFVGTVYNRNINLDSRLKNCRFTGDLSGLNLDEALQIIKASSSLEMRTDKNIIYLTGPSCD